MTLYPTLDASTNEWVFDNGKRLPVVSGGDPTAVPGSAVTINVPAAAQEGDPAKPAETTPTGKTFSTEEVEAIRRQEKDKVYGKVEKLEQQINIFNEEREAQLALAAEAAQKEEDERKAREQDEMSARELLTAKEDEFDQRLNTAQEEWEKKFLTLQEQSDAQRTLLETERKFQELESFKNRRIAEAQDELMPELLDFIQGNTEEEIETSISAVAARTSAIVENMQAALPAPIERPRGIQPTGQTPTGPLEANTEQQTFTAADLASMDMTTYAANREKLIAAASNMRR